MGAYFLLGKEGFLESLPCFECCSLTEPSDQSAQRHMEGHPYEQTVGESSISTNTDHNMRTVSAETTNLVGCEVDSSDIADHCGSPKID